MIHDVFTNRERAEVLTQALPYIKRYVGKIVVIKYGGNAMIDENLKQQVMEDIALLWLIGVKVVLIHGGGPEISDMMKRLGKQPEFVNGLRVTDKETVDIVQMVLAGKVNKSLVTLLQMKGGHAVGLSGMDGGIIEAKIKDERLGFVGQITKVRGKPITDLLEKNYIPVISTVASDKHGNVYNITNTLQQTADISKHMLTFLENHDEQRIASDFFVGDGFNAIPAFIVSATVGVQPFMLYAGQELGEKGMDQEGYSGVDGRTTIFDYWSVDTLRRWCNGGKYDTARLTKEEKQLQSIYSQVLNLCNSEEAISDGTFYDLQYANPNSSVYDACNVYSYLRGTEKELLLIVVNFSKETRRQEIRIPVEAFSYHKIEPQEKSVKATELLTGKSVKCKLNPDVTIPVDLPALGAIILKFKL